MSSIRRPWVLALGAACCVAVGAGVSAIATAGAATSTPKSAGSPVGHRAAARLGLRGGGLRRLARAVQGSAVIHTKAGFSTITFERGTVKSVTGDQLTIAEGTPAATYRTVTVTVPTNAVVRDDRHTASLSMVKAGQRVLVLQAPKRTYVIARAARTP